MQLKKANVKKVVDICRRLFVVGEDGFEPSKRNAADLQSVPFGHSGTPPDVQLLSARTEHAYYITESENVNSYFDVF